MPARRIAIAGGGIGGMMAAAALAHDGVDVVVLERAPNLDHVSVGGGIHLWPNGQRALAYLDGRDQLLREELEPEAYLKRASFDTWRGSPILQWDTHETLCVLRGKLHGSLVEAVPQGAIRTGAAVQDFHEAENGVSVVLDTGETVEADAFIGADGLWSTVRSKLFGDGKPRYAGYTTWTGVVDIDLDETPGLFRIFFGRGARFLYYPVGRAKLYWEASALAPQGGRDAEGGHRAAALSYLPGFSEPTETIIAATDESAIVRSDSYDRAPTRDWVSGRVALLGDAAHPMTNALGQGANQAMEDAVVLADALARTGDVPTALLDYQRRRIPRANKMVKLSHMLAGMHMWRSRPAVFGRTAFMRTFGRVVVNATRRDVVEDFMAV